MRIIIKNLQKKIPLSPRKTRKVALKSLSAGALRKSGEITVCFVNDKRIRELNRKYLNSPCATDVISFELSRTSREIIADIAISTDTAMRNAKIYRTSPTYEAYLYVAHGILHLIGYDDSSRKKKAVMQHKADQILNSCSIT